MKVAYILCSGRKQYGSSKAFLNIVRDAGSYNCTPIVIMPEEGELTQDLQSQGVTVYTVPFKSSAYPDCKSMSQKLLFFPRLTGRIIINLLAIFNISKILRQENIDIVHTNTGINNVGYYAARRLGIPHIFHIREFADKVGFRNFPSLGMFRKKLLKNGNWNIFVTRGLKDYYMPAKEVNSIVIYDGVLHHKDRLVVNTERTNMTYVGRIERNKGLEQLLEAYSLALKETEGKLLPLTIVGEESDKEFADRMNAYVLENNLSDKVTFLGHRNDVADIMQRSVCVIISSHSEGFGFVTAEAMFNGSIVIGRNNTGTKEQLDNGFYRTGREIGFRFENTQELVCRLIQVCQMSNSDIEKMRNDAFETANNIYTIENNTRQIYNLYESVANITIKY